MPSSESSHVNAALAPVAPSDRRFTALDSFTLWLSLGVGLLVLQAGALLVPGLGFGQAGLVILLGSGIGVLLLALTGVIGSDTGLPTMAAVRPTLGTRGARLPALLNVVQLVGWGAFELIVMRDAVDAIAQRLGAPALSWLWTLVFGALVTGLAFGGPLAFVRVLLRRFGIWLVLGAGAWLTWQLLTSPQIGNVTQHRGDGSMPFGVGLDLAIAMPLSWLPLIADYTRYGRSSKGVFWGVALGYFIANVWFYSMGAGYALALGGDNLVQSILLASGGLIALAMIVGDETDNAFADVYSAAVSSATLLPALRVSTLALTFGALCTAVALLIPVGQYEHFLLMIGSVFAPLFGVVITDHFVVRGRRYDGGAPGAALPMLRYTALAAWLGGIVVHRVVSAWAADWGATLPSLLAASLIYLVLSRVSRR